MNRLCFVFLGALLFALHLTSQVQATNHTMAPETNQTVNVTMDHHNMTGNSTQDKSAGGRPGVSVLLLPLALGFLYSCS